MISLQACSGEEKLFEAAYKYDGIVSKAIRKHDPDHLILGGGQVIRKASTDAIQPKKGS